MILAKKMVTTSVGCLLLLPHFCYSTVLVTGDPAAAPAASFTAPVSATAFDPATGSFYVGLSNVDSTYTIARADRPLDRISLSMPVFAGIAPSSLASGVSAIALVTFPGNNTRSPNLGAPLVAYTPNTSGSNVVCAVEYFNSAKSNCSGPLNDAAGMPASGTVGLAANCAYIFTGVAPSTGAFGTLDSGIAVVCVKENSSTIVLNQTAAEPGVSTPQAKQLDTTTPQVYINPALPPAIGTAAFLFWSDYLKRLYIGLDIDATTSGAGGKAVVVARLFNGTLIFSDIAPNAAIDPLGIDVVATTDAGNILIPFVKTMHASTGPSYLIANGGDITTIPDALSRISALPLVDNPNDFVNQGTLAKYNAPLVDYKFVTPAATIGDLAVYNQNPVMVGTGPLPAFISTTTSAGAAVVSDIEVIGDTVYVAIEGVQSYSVDNGVFYSQAQFDATGKISHWTPWTKRAFPYNGFCDPTDCQKQIQSFCEPPAPCTSSCCQNMGVAYVAVDAVNGKVWAVNGINNQVVRLTVWDRGSCVSQLPCQVNEALPCGCYSVLDLDQSTTGFTEGFVSGNMRNTTENRYALFGGCNSVVFTRVSEAIPTDNYITLTSPQKIETDFCPIPRIDCCTTSTGITNFRVTELPKNSGCVYQLEYSRTGSTAGTTNYFFAGTNTGLYIFANPDGSGFNVTELTTLDQPPFSTGVWFPTPITDSIVAIKALGNYLYVVTRTTINRTIVCNVYQIPFATSIDLMFTPQPTPIATSGQGVFANVLLFTGLETISDGITNQILLSTNQGLFVSTPPTPFTQIPSGGTIMFAGVGGIDMTNQTTVWPFSVDPFYCKTFGASTIFQLSGPNPTNFVPEFFNARCAQCPFCELYPITYFWSDGARRFFIVNRPCDCQNQNRLMIFPFAVEAWNVNIPIDQILIYDSFIDGVARFNWIRTIGATGILMAGVNDGVIALE